MRHLILIILATTACTSVLKKDGKEIVVRDDGTWRFEEQLKIPAPTVIERPPFSSDKLTSSSRSAIKLVKKSQVANKITDGRFWLSRHKLGGKKCSGSQLYRKGTCPDRAPKIYGGTWLIKGWSNGDNYNLYYGPNGANLRYLVIADSKLQKVVKAYDFLNFQRAPKSNSKGQNFTHQSVRWAAIQDNVLYVSTSHRSYAKYSGGLNAYLTAIDLKSDKILWQSEPLVSNSENFVFYGDIIISGYGFTAEPDFLYLIDKKTGRKLDSVKVKSGPSYLVLDGDRLSVRTYNTDYVFELK